MSDFEKPQQVFAKDGQRPSPSEPNPMAPQDHQPKGKNESKLKKFQRIYKATSMSTEVSLDPSYSKLIAREPVSEAQNWQINENPKQEMYQNMVYYRQASQNVMPPSAPQMESVAYNNMQQMNSECARKGEPTTYFMNFPKSNHYIPMFNYEDEEEITHQEQKAQVPVRSSGQKLKSNSFRIHENSDEENKDFEIYQNASKIIEDEFENKLDINADAKGFSKTKPVNETGSMYSNLWKKPNDGSLRPVKADGGKPADQNKQKSFAQMQGPPGFNKGQQLREQVPEKPKEGKK